MTMLLIQYLLCVHIHTKNVIIQFIIIVCFFIYFNVKFIFWKEGSFIQTKVGDKQQKPTPAFFFKRCEGYIFSLLTGQFHFVCNFSPAVPNWHSLLQDFERRCLGTSIFDLTLWSLTCVSFHEYFIVLYKVFVKHKNENNLELLPPIELCHNLFLVEQS